jgi:hypothetical protein
VDIHKAKVTKEAHNSSRIRHKEDADLTTQIEELQATLQTLKGEYAILDKAYKNDLTRLYILTTS